jgi:hypothetical protein
MLRRSDDPLLRDTRAERQATVRDPALGLQQISLQRPASFSRKPPIQLAAAAPLHGIYSIDDWEAAIPKKNCNEATHYSKFVRRLLPMPPRLAPRHTSIAAFSTYRS